MKQLLLGQPLFSIFFSISSRIYFIWFSALSLLSRLLHFFASVIVLRSVGVQSNKQTRRETLKCYSYILFNLCTLYYKKCGKSYIKKYWYWIKWIQGKYKSSKIALFVPIVVTKVGSFYAVLLHSLFRYNVGNFNGYCTFWKFSANCMLILVCTVFASLVHVCHFSMFCGSVSVWKVCPVLNIW